jgi:hypothetical protein
MVHQRKISLLLPLLLVSLSAHNLIPMLFISATISSVDTAGNVGIDTSLTIGADGLGLISYQDATNMELKVAHCSNIDCS